MKKFYLEGLYLTKRGAQKAKKKGFYAHTDLEPFAQAFYANSLDEAIQLANETLQGGEWVEGPKLSKKSEEDRMRALGAPELPGLFGPAKKAARPKGKSKTSK